MFHNLRARYRSWRERQLLARLFATQEGGATIKTNRANLATVTDWIEESRYQNSIFNYGLPPHLRPHIDAPFDGQPTYSDLMVLLTRRLRAPLRYLEIGPSVGKNLFQVLRANPGAQAAAIDIEEENPPLLRGLMSGETRPWSSRSAQRPSAYTRRHRDPLTGTELLYICADELEPESWLPLRGRKFNMIFSDALHEPQALFYELGRLREHELFDEQEFVMLWDDLHVPRLGEAFPRIAGELRRQFGARRTRAHRFWVNGWVGSREEPHLVGLITYNVRI